MNIGVHVSFQINVFFFFFWIYTQEYNCWLMWQFYFQLFEKTLQHFSQWLHLFMFPPTVYEDSLFFTFSPMFITCALSDDNHSDKCDVVISVVLICIPLMIDSGQHLFTCLLTIYMSSSEKCLFRSSAHFKNQIVFCFDIELYDLFMYFGFNLYWSHHLCIFSSIQQIVFLFCQWFPLLYKNFSTQLGPMCYFCFYVLCFTRQIQKSIATIYVIQYSAYVFLLGIL